MGISITLWKFDNVKIKIALSKDEVRILIKILVGDLGPS